jgi:hypothetical protein
MDRAIIIGDVHGCYFELRALLVGDLITKGPAHREVLDFVRATRHCASVMGNNELALLRFWRGEKASLTRPQLQAMAALGEAFPRYMEWIAGFPRLIEMSDFVVVHAGLRPGIALAKQKVDDLTELRSLEESGVPWFDQYEGKTAVFGIGCSMPHWKERTPSVSIPAVSTVIP